MNHLQTFSIQRLFFYLILSITLVSCASTERLTGSDITDTYTSDDIPRNYKYPAWRLADTQDMEAINMLLDESDRLIEDNALDAATDKLERVLRIQPYYAPAWSRLSWVALQSDDPARSVEMAKRSNSFAQSDPELLLLNWSFIRSASQQLNDEKTYRQADQKINDLKSM